MCTVLPSLIGLSKEMLSTEAVTTGALQCFCAAIAAAMSIQYINLPPIRFPYTFVSFGRTISVIIVLLSEDFLGSIALFFPKVRAGAELRRSLRELIGIIVYCLLTITFATLNKFGTKACYGSK